MQLQSFHKIFAILVVFQTIQPEIAKLEEKAAQEVDKNRSTRNQKTNKTTHVSQSRYKT